MTNAAPFTRDHRLLTARSFQQVMNQPTWRASQRSFLLLAKANNLPHARIGFVLPKRRVRLAVARNRVKRIIREAFRCHLELLAGLDIVVMARDGLADLDNPALRSAVENQFQYIARKYQRPTPPVEDASSLNS